jgi:hypothetical protein
MFSDVGPSVPERLKDFNDEQEDAVAREGARFLVPVGAGKGKLRR